MAAYPETTEPATVKPPLDALLPLLLLLLLQRVGVDGGTNMTALTVPTAAEDTDDNTLVAPIPTALVLFVLLLVLLLVWVRCCCSLREALGGVEAAIDALADNRLGVNIICAWTSLRSFLAGLVGMDKPLLASLRWVDASVPAM